MNQGNDFQDNSNQSQDGGNPFSVDLKSDFTSNFESNTNAVSHIFKDGGFVGENKTRLIGLVVVLALLVGGYFFMGRSDEDAFGEEDFVVADEGSDEDKDLEGLAEDEGELGEEADALPAEDDTEDTLVDTLDEEEGLVEDDMVGEEAAPAYPRPARAEPALPPATVAPALVAPDNGAVRDYDETAQSPEFSWDGSPGGMLVLSQDPAMEPVVVQRRVDGNSYRLRQRHLKPGTWYWQVRNGAGASEVRSVVVKEWVPRSLQLVEPGDGATLTGSGGTVSWTGDAKVARYAVEISNSGWKRPNYLFGTVGTQLRVEGVAPGAYELRVKAFSEVSGRWEKTDPIRVTVQ